MIFTLISSGDINYGKGDAYVRWGIIFLVIALIAAALGFGGWPVPLQAQLKLSLSSGLFCSGEFVHGPKTTLDFRPLRKFIQSQSSGLAFAVLANNKLRYLSFFHNKNRKAEVGQRIPVSLVILRRCR